MNNSDPEQEFRKLKREENDKKLRSKRRIKKMDEDFVVEPTPKQSKMSYLSENNERSSVNASERRNTELSDMLSKYLCRFSVLRIELFILNTEKLLVLKWAQRARVKHSTIR